MKTYPYLITFIIIAIISFSCEEELPEANELGSISLAINIEIEEVALGISPAGRLNEPSTIDTDNFKVTIFNEDHNEYMVFDPFSKVPESIDLPTGLYYVIASSNNEQNAAFDEPFYYGKTEIFSIDKEEQKAITVQMIMSNTQVSIIWSDNIKSDFSGYSAKVAIIDSDDFLTFDMNETRSGYFSPSPLQIEATLNYTKLDGEIIEKTFTSTIVNTKAKTHYIINIDAKLNNGEITLILNIDQSVDVINIVLEETNTDKVWRKLISGANTDEAYALEPTTDGGLVAIGISDNQVENYGYADFIAVKLDAFGNTEWVKTYGGGGFEQGQDIVQVSDGGFIMCGQSSSSDGEVSQNNGGSDIWVLKADIAGKILWEKSIGTESNEFGSHVIEANDGSILVAGYQDDGTGSWTYAVSKLSSAGQLLWEKYYGGSGRDEIVNIAENSNGEFMIIGKSSSIDGDRDSSEEGIWVLNLADADGSINWQVSMPSGLDLVSASNLNHTYMVYSTTSFGRNFMTISNADGSIQSDVEISESDLGNSETLVSIRVLDNGNFIAAGHSQVNGFFNPWLAEYNVAFSKVWDNTFVESETCYAEDGIMLNNGTFVSLGRLYSENEESDILFNSYIPQ